MPPGRFFVVHSLWITGAAVLLAAVGLARWRAVAGTAASRLPPDARFIRAAAFGGASLIAAAVALAPALPVWGRLAAAAAACLALREAGGRADR